jgi:ubiquitin-activating enzyme E1 C
MVVCGLDSITARRWINSMLLSLLEFDDAGDLKQHTMIPIIDGGTEGALLPCRVPCMLLCTCPRCKSEHTAVSDPTAPAASGFKGNARVLFPGISACVECMLDLFPPQVRGRESAKTGGAGRASRATPTHRSHPLPDAPPLKKINFPMCTIANTPRLPEHCIEYVKVRFRDCQA